jgi:hypothetical protein
MHHFFDLPRLRPEICFAEGRCLNVHEIANVVADSIVIPLNGRPQGNSVPRSPWNEIREWIAITGRRWSSVRSSTAWLFIASINYLRGSSQGHEFKQNNFEPDTEIGRISAALDHIFSCEAEAIRLIILYRPSSPAGFGQ